MGNGKKGTMASWVMVCVLVFGGLTTVRAEDFSENFDARTLGAYIGQSQIWQGYPGGTFESPVVDNTTAFSGTKCLSNGNDPANHAEEQRSYMETVPTIPVISGQDITAEFKFMKTQDWGTFTNQIRFILEDTVSGRKVGLEIRDGKIRDYYAISGEILYQLNAWYRVKLELVWMGTAYHTNALCTVYDAAGSVVGINYPRVTGEQPLPQVNKVWVLMDSGYENGAVMPRPNNFMDDIFVTGLSAGPTPTVYANVIGTVDLGSNYVGDRRDVGMRVEFLQGTMVMRTEWVMLQADGTFSVPAVQEGTYDIAFRAGGWLKKTLTNKVVLAQPTNLGTINLVGGDTDGDNQVTSADLSIVLGSLDLAGD